MKLREARELRGLSQQEMADCLGLSRMMYVKYEMAARMPSLELLVRMADYLGVSVDFLLGRDEHEEGQWALTQNEKEMICGMRAAEPKLRQAIYLVVTTFLREEKRFEESTLYQISERLAQKE